MGTEVELHVSTVSQALLLFVQRMIFQGVNTIPEEFRQSLHQDTKAAIIEEVWKSTGSEDRTRQHADLLNVRIEIRSVFEDRSCSLSETSCVVSAGQCPSSFEGDSDHKRH